MTAVLDRLQCLNTCSTTKANTKLGIQNGKQGHEKVCFGVSVVGLGKVGAETRIVADNSNHCGLANVTETFKSNLEFIIFQKFTHSKSSIESPSKS